MVEFWVGETNRPLVKKHAQVMDSAANYYASSSLKIPYSYDALFLDSGAYTFTRRGLSADKEKIKRIQEKLDPDRAIPLDYPFLPRMTLTAMRRLWEKTAENTLEWQNTTRLRSIVPVLHAWDNKSLVDNIKWIYKKVDCEYVAVGTIVTPKFSRFTGYFGDRHPSLLTITLILRAIQLIKHYTELKVHLTGFGSSPLTLHLAYFMGAESVDSMGYKRKAAYGKILLPGVGERYAGRGDASFGVKPLSPSELKLLSECRCPICSTNQSLLWRDWKARAIHNKYVLEKEAEVARRLLAEDPESYTAYLDEIYAHSSKNFMAYWKFVKNNMKQLPLDFWIWR
ncbi:MAG: hypothetical protein QXK32_04790 [Candidatus Jordarchaeales archaeon]